MRSYVLLAMALGLCACASMEQTQGNPSLQSAVYVAGESAPQPKPMPAADVQQPADGMQAPSKLMRLHWFFGGR